MTLSNLFGVHSAMFFYGPEHLNINMYLYITAGIKNNELVYISAEDALYKNILKNLKMEDNLSVRFKSVREVILAYKDGGEEGLRKEFLQLAAEAREEGYTGIRYIGQPRFAMQETSKTDFLNWEKGLSTALRGLPISLICIYDMEDYFKDKELIDDQVLRESFSTHSYVLYKLEMRHITNGLNSLE